MATASRILVVDDEPDFLETCGNAMQIAGHDCDLCCSAEDAEDRFRRDMYDGIVCDILIPYKGLREGGLALAREFAIKNPNACLILTSQYVTAKWVNQFAGVTDHAFVEKGATVIEDLITEIRRIVRSRFAFVCMPFASKFDDIYEAGIKPAVLRAGFKCKRADEFNHNTDIWQVVQDNIKSAHLIIADITGRNANVFYEVGYAHALGKEVILLTQKVSDIPFDLQSLNHIVYSGRIITLKSKLTKRLTAFG